MRTQIRGERGASAVEFALVVPILLLFTFGIIEYGNYFMTDLRATNSAMVGARALAIGDSDWAAQAAAASGSGYAFRPENNCADSATTADLPAHSVAVTATSTYHGLFGDIIPHPSTITARGVVRCET